MKIGRAIHVKSKKFKLPAPVKELQSQHQLGLSYFPLKITNLEYPKIAEFLNAWDESLIWDEDLPVHRDDVAVRPPHPGHRLVIKIAGDRTQSDPAKDISQTNLK